MKKFKKVYFILQTTPILTRSTYVFSRKAASEIQNMMRKQGYLTQVVSFTREELEDLKSEHTL